MLVWYIWNQFPFGWSGPPFYFHKCIRAVIEFLRGAHKLSVMAYVDYFLLTATLSDIVTHMQVLLSNLSELGLTVNHENSCPDPSDCVTYLGFDVHCATPERPPHITVPNFQNSNGLCRVCSNVSAFQLVSWYRLRAAVLACLLPSFHVN